MLGIKTFFLQIFQRVPLKNLRKITGLASELTQDKLGLSANNLMLLIDVNIVFHCAASVRFDDPLKEAILMNTKGTFELLELALNMPFLDCFVYVSTTYCETDNITIEEKLYPTKVCWRSAVKIAENISTEDLNALTYKFIDFKPNSYVFSKGLSESMISEYKNLLPLVIYRPSIILPAEDEPMPGYVANFNGPMGAFTATAVGILRTQWMPEIGELNGVPIDTCVKGLIVAAYARSLKSSELLPVYNAASIKRFTYVYICKAGKKYVASHCPPEQILWRPGGRITKCVYDFYLRVRFYFFFPIKQNLINFLFS